MADWPMLGHRDPAGHESQADCAAARLSLPTDQKLSLQRDTDGRLTFSLRG